LIAARVPAHAAFILRLAVVYHHGGKVEMLLEELHEPVDGLGDRYTHSFGQDADVLLSKPTLFENYHCGKLIIHVHVSVLRNGERSNWCLEMSRLEYIFGQDEQFPVHFDGGKVAWSRASSQNGYVNFPVLVLVCETSESHQIGRHRVSPTLVRLQALNNCHCLKGNTKESVSTNFLIKTTVAMGEGELVGRLWGFAWVVLPEEFTNKVVKTRICGLDNVPEDVGNFSGRPTESLEIAPNFGLRFVISLGEPNVFSIDMGRDSLIEEIEMMACPR
jgi:hypothetical protein